MIEIICQNTPPKIRLKLAGWNFFFEIRMVPLIYDKLAVVLNYVLLSCTLQQATNMNMSLILINYKKIEMLVLFVQSILILRSSN